MDNVITFDFVDELKIEGVNYKGYGVLPKYVMLDADLTIEAKGIYAYFCSYAGSGNTSFPSRDKIVADLMINKDTYYKHFNVLTLQGYISVQQLHNHGGRGAGFMKNVYTLITNPKKFEDKPEDVKRNRAYVRIRFGGLTAAGFGFIPKAVMLDNRLPLKSKAVYAYFCSFTGSGNSAFPKKDNILFHLGIAEKTYYKSYKLLTELNYITVVQRQIDGRLSVNDYILNPTPDESKAAKKAVVALSKQDSNFSDTQAPEKQDSNFSDTQAPEKQDGNFSDTQAPEKQDGNFSDTQKQDTQKQDTQKQDTLNPDTNNNNTKNNNSKSNQSITQQAAQPPCPAEPEQIDGWIDDEYMNYVFNELLAAKTLPYNYLADEKKLTAAIRVMCEWDTFSKEESYFGVDSSISHSAYITFVEALIEMLTVQPEPMKLKGALVTYGKVYDRLTRYIKVDDTISAEYVSIGELLDSTKSDFIKACGNIEIKHPLQYMKSCIWNAMQIGSLSVDALIKRDFG